MKLTQKIQTKKSDVCKIDCLKTQHFASQEQSNVAYEAFKFQLITA